MTSQRTVFELCWEICNKLGGIHTVLSSKAATAVARLGDDRYWTVGPWLLSDTDRSPPFEEEAGYADFAEACRAMGLPVRVGRWKVPGRPRCLLVEFSSLYDTKNEVLTWLWEEFGVDSIEGAWDYVEPVLFGWAAGKVLEEFWDRYLAPEGRGAIVHAHEWVTGSAVLYLQKHVPAIGTVFTTHSTLLGRTLSSAGRSPADGLGDDAVHELARHHDVQAKHSLEGSSARHVDVFTTVSQLTAKEAELLLGRAADPVLPNGIDLAVVDELAGSPDHRAEVRARVEDIAVRFLGTPDLHGAAFLAISGRYEFHNKGIDLLLDAVAKLEGRAGRPVILWVLVPAGNSGLRSEVRERLSGPTPAEPQDPIGILTHHLFDEDGDAIRSRCAALGLTNATGARVKVIYVPVYLGPGDGLVDAEYEAVLAAMDLGVFPSFYEPWGYTPQEALAVGVPTVTSDYTGLGRWAKAEGLTEADGITVLERVGHRYEDNVEALAGALERFLATPAEDAAALRAQCRAVAARTAWSDLYRHYETAYARAGGIVDERTAAGVLHLRKPRPQVVVRPASVPAPRLKFFEVAATLPEALRPLELMARNLWWCWDRDVPRLFEEISPTRWSQSGHNPIQALRRAFPEDLATKAADRRFVERVRSAYRRFDAYLATRRNTTPIGEGAALSRDHPVAYFCAEFGLHESMPVYSGGLGVLAGDHLKSASDLNIPLIGIGLFYRHGYMGQALTADGTQIAVDRENDPAELPMELVRDRDGEPLEVRVPMPGRDVALRTWLVRVGRVDLYLLDANTPSNRDEDREITRNLYGGDHEMRIRQLIALGRGGVRLLGELGIEPAAWHMNEGHAGFLTLERLGRLVRRKGLTFETAREAIRGTTAFTTHTPVPAGHDRFSEDLMRRYFSDVPEWVGVPWDRFLGFGSADAKAGEFNMTYLALTFSSFCNGVSKLHGAATRDLLHPYWPNLLRDEVPIETITNGVHLPTWTSPRLAELLGAPGPTVTGKDFATRAADLDGAALWNVRRALKCVLLERVEERLHRAFVGRSDSPAVLSRIVEGLDPDALWIGFARRFAPYKRANLLYTDPERLRRLCDDADRPVRILVAGKAHPRDQHGQQILRNIVELSRRGDLVGRVIFVEDYDIDLARSLVQGIDVWLNNPTRMLEASGTSGMKVAANGGLNLSIADGWWPEGADGKNGWTIGKAAKVYAEQHLQDELDAATLYRMLEEDVVPLYFERDADGLPQGWLDMVVHSLATLPPMFDTDRMVAEYSTRAYEELGRNHFAMQTERDRARDIAESVTRIRKGFESIRIVEVRHTEVSDVRVGDPLEAVVRVQLGELDPSDVEVELVIGNAARTGDDLHNPMVVPLSPHGEPDGDVWEFEGRHQIARSGRWGAGVRVRPRRISASPSSLRDLVLWA